MLTGRVGLSPVMVGRSALADRLTGVLDAAEVCCSDMPAVVLVSGEAGIGKTRLIREAFDALGSTPTMLSAQAEPGSLGRPRDVVRQLVPAGIDDTVEAAVEALVGVAGAGRTVVVVEDLHWIDADSAEVLDRLARQPLPQLVIVATLRPGDLERGAPGGDLVLRLERRNEVDHLRLDRLDRAEVGAMMAAIADAAVTSAAVETVFRRSGGVPFVVEELMRFAGPDVCSLDIAEARLPWSLEEAVRQQVAGLAPEERAIVEALAVFGEPMPFDVLAGVVDLAEAELLHHLRALLARDVVVESREDRIWFTHALVADSVAGQLLGRERRRLHQRCLDVLEALAGEGPATDVVDTAAMARHARGAGQYEQVACIARSGAPRYLDEGASFQALRLACEGLAEDPDDADLLSVATRAAWRLDFLPEARTHADAWLRAVRDDEERIQSLLYVARLALEMGDHDACDERLAELVALADDPPSDDPAVRRRLAGRAAASVAQLHMISFRQTEAVTWADRAIEDATAVGDDITVASALVERSGALAHSADRPVAIAALEAAVAAAERLGDEVMVSRALTNAMGLFPPHRQRARDLRRRLVAAVRASGLDKLGTFGSMWWAAAEARALGDQVAYRRQLESIVSVAARPLGTDHGFVMDQVWFAAEEGRLDRCRNLLATAQVQEKHHCEHLRIVLQVAALERDETAGRLQLERVAGSRPPDDDWWALDVVTDITQSALSLGIDPDEVERRIADEWLAGHTSAARLTPVVRGLAASAAGRHAAAVEHLAPVLGDLEEHVPAPVAACILLAYATSAVGLGRRADAIEAARRAATDVERWPGWRRDRVDAMVRRLEGAPSRAEGELTARELEVAALLAEGLTNGQLAERLFISPKTAAVHVSNILAKLGLSTRAEIAAWAVRRGIPTAA